MLSNRDAPSAWIPQLENGELREYWQVFVQRRLTICATLLAALCASALFLQLATPLFTAETLLRIERVDPHVIDIESVASETLQLGGADEYYNTQYALLQSRTLAARVLGALAMRGSQAFLAPAGAPAGEAEPSDVVVDRYLHQLVIEPVGQSRLVRLRFSAADPDVAASVVNAHARAFIESGIELRAQASSEAADFLGGSLEGLRHKVEEARAALTEFRRKHDIVSLDDKADIVIDRLEDLNRRLTAAQNDRIAREADLKLVRRRSYESLPAVIQSELIRQLKQDLAPLEREYAVLAPAVTPSYAGLATLRTRIAEAERGIDAEIQHIVQGIESDFLAARNRETELQAQLEREKKAALRVKDDSVRYAVLKQDLEAALSLYESVRQRGEETAMVRGMPSTNVSVVDEARARPVPSSPRRAQVLVLGALLGLLGGLGLALALDMGSRALGSERDVTRRLGLATLGAIPAFGAGARARRRRRSTAQGAPAAERPPEAVQDLYRCIRNEVVVERGETPPRTLLVCSADAGEGATTTALNLAIACAQLGSPTLLIDANLRSPGCHEPLRVPLRPGLADMLHGKPAELHTVPIGEHSLYFLAAGSGAESANDLLASPRLREALAKLREQFEHVVIDGPPLARASDSRVLAARVDAVLLVADARKADWRRARSALDGLRASRAAVRGVILNRVGSASAAESADSRRKGEG